MEGERRRRLVDLVLDEGPLDRDEVVRPDRGPGRLEVVQRRLEFDLDPLFLENIQRRLVDGRHPPPVEPIDKGRGLRHEIDIERHFQLMPLPPTGS
jgi:hypothetical protein